MRFQYPDGGKTDGARTEEIQDPRKPEAYAGGVDPVAGGVFGEPQGLGAVGIERSVSQGRIDRPPPLERGEMSDELDGRFALLADEVVDPGEQVLVRQ